MRFHWLLLVTLVAVAPVAAQTRDARLTVKRIFADQEFAGAEIPEIVWMRDGASYVELRAAKSDSGSDLVRVDVATGAVTMLAPASALVDERGRRLDVERFSLSDDERTALLFHNSVQVWRKRTRGVYHVIDLKTKKVAPVSRKPGLQMFAKFSPDGRRVAFVRDNNLVVSDPVSGNEDQLTRDGSETIINGTTDWVYEEELSLADAFRWSPDGKRIAFWRFDQSAIPEFPLVDELTVYPTVRTLRYPKAGAPNSRVKLGVVLVSGATHAVTWLDVGSGNDQYLARMDWVGADSVVVQRLPRSQASIDVMIVSASTGKPRLIFTDRDSAYVDVQEGELRWIDGNKRFLWLSDRSGWRQAFVYDRSGTSRQVTTDGMDVLDVVGVDEQRGDVYITAAAPTPVQRNVYRCSLQASGCSRVTTEAGSHAVSIGPGARWAVDTYSSLNRPPAAFVYELPAMTRRRTIEDNAELTGQVGTLGLSPAQMITVPLPDGTVLDGWRIVPPAFDSTRKYPVLMFVYGGPAAPTVVDEWGYSTFLWHQLLAQHDYIVVSVDNRGAAWRGRDFRKVTQLRLGQMESQDQMDVARWIGRQSWGDAARIGIWGWSYGGYLTALTATRGGDIFKMALVVSPVTDWRLYDTIYTERYMRTPQENPQGYSKGSPQNYVEGLKARTLLVHGTGDDNVHVQNTLQLADKLEGAGKVFSMLLYPNRTHSLSERNATPQLRESFTRFILDNL